MLEGQDFPVPVPEKNLLGRSLITTNGYVYWVTKAVWNSDKQQSEDNRKSIGKLIFSMEGYDSVKQAVKAARQEAKDNPEKKLMMWANEEYPKLFTDLPETEELIHNSIMGFGVYLFALKSAEQTGVLAAIQKAFPKHWSKVFAICVQWIDTPTDVSQIFETWFYDHFCGFYTALDPSAFTDFYKQISHIPYVEKIYRRTVCEEYSTRFPPEEGKIRRAVGCILTGHNHESDSNSPGGFGYAKVDKSCPIFNRMTFVDEGTGLTIFSELFPGPIPDKTEILHTMDKLAKMGFQELHLMFDHGFPTKDTVILFQELKKTHNICFSAMVPIAYSFADKYIESCMHAVKEEKNFIKNHNIYGLHLPDSPVFLKETSLAQSLAEDSLFDIYVFYDDYRAADERSSLNDKLAAIENAIEEHKDYSSALDTLAGSYFTIKPCNRDPESGRNFTWERNYDVIQLEKNKKGYFLIVSNGGMSAAEEILIARRRDCNEKADQRRKTFLGLVTPGTETDETFKGQNLIGDIAQNIIESMVYFTAPFLNRNRSETIETVIAKLRRYKIEFNDDGTAKPAHGMRSDEKEMFSCLDLSSEIIEQYMRTITWGETPSMILNETEFKKKQEQDKQKEKEAKKAQRAAKKAEKARADKEERGKRELEEGRKEKEQSDPNTDNQTEN